MINSFLIKKANMNKTLNILCSIALTAIILLSSCKNNKVSTEEKTTIETRDSVSRTATDVKNKLDKQTEAVEASIEKMDEEFK